MRANRYSLLFFFTAVNLVRGEQPPFSGYLVSSLLDLAASGSWDFGPTGSLDWAAGLEKEVPGLITCAVDSFAYAIFKRKDFASADFIQSRVLPTIFGENEDVGIQLAKQLYLRSQLQHSRALGTLRSKTRACSLLSTPSFRRDSRPLPASKC